MKKLILTSACVLAVTGAALAQGTVQWTTISFSAFTGATNTTISSFLSVGGSAGLSGGTSGPTVGSAAGSFYYELLYNTAGSVDPTSLTTLDSWSDTGLEADNSSFANGGRVQSLNQNVAAVMPFSTTQDIIMVGWSANLGTTWTAVSAVLNSGNIPTGSFFGETPVGTLTPFAAGTNPGQNPFGAPGIVSLNTPLEPITTPEPTTIALGVMGAASLLAFRRKKA